MCQMDVFFGKSLIIDFLNNLCKKRTAIVNTPGSQTLSIKAPNFAILFKVDSNFPKNEVWHCHVDHSWIGLDN